MPGVQFFQGLAANLPTAGVAGAFYYTTDAHKLYYSDGMAMYLIGPSAGGAGTVTSVGLAMPSIFTVSGSPVTTSGTLTAALASESQNTVFAGPTSGSGVPTFRALTAADLPATATMPTCCCVRLTGQQGIPVPTANYTTSTLYLEPYAGDRITLWDGTNLVNIIVPPSTISLALPATTNTMYDVWCYASGTSPALELTSWTNDSTRTTALVMSNGFLCKSGDATRRYIGTVRTQASSGTTVDSVQQRYIWNYYNRMRRRLVFHDTAVTWTQSAASWRQANVSASAQFDVVIGVATAMVDISVHMGGNFSAGATSCAFSIGDNSPNLPSGPGTPHPDCTGGILQQNAPDYNAHSCRLITVPTAGRHIFSHLEYCQANVAITWVNVAVASQYGGMSGWVEG